MNDNHAITELIRRGRAILRTSTPARRQRKWREWAQEVESYANAEGVDLRRRLTLNYDTVVDDVEQLTLVAEAVETATPADAPAQPDSSAVEISVDSGTEEGAQDTAAPRARSVDSEVKVFLSYLSVDESIARVVRNCLHALSDRVDVFAAYDDMRTGTRWKQQLNEEIAAADWFILIYTDPRKNWQWPIHEATSFEASNIKADSSDRRLCCLHDTEERPSPLSDYQNHIVDLFIPDLADDEETRGLKKKRFYEDSLIYNFFRNFCAYPEHDPLKSDLRRAEALIVSACHDIAEAFASNRTDDIRNENYYPPRLTVSIKPSETMTSAEVVAASTLDVGPIAQRLFRITQQEDSALSWKEFKETILQLADDVMPRWIGQVEEALIDATNGIEPTPITALMYSQYTRRFYRPVIARQQYYVSGARNLLIVFSEQPSLDFSEHEEQGTILASLIVGSRFRFEFIDKELKALERADSEEQIFAKLLDIKGQIEEIEDESAQHGLLDPHAMTNLFKGQDKRRIEEMFSEWAEIRSVIFDTIELSKTPDFDANKAQMEIVHRVRKDLIKLNNDFMNIASSRYRELVRKKFVENGNE